MTVRRDPGSFRDPAASVWIGAGRTFRALGRSASDNFDWLKRSGAYERLTRDHGLLPGEPLAGEPGLLPETDDAPSAVRWLEHPTVPFVSYPYEWPFALLKRAALAHLDLHIAALEHDVTIIDGTAYNVQFLGPKPVFIDTPALVPYADGDFWQGYKQFCEQFLAPLTIAAKLGVSYNAWYRGALDGLDIEAVARVLPMRAKMLPGIFAHIVAQAMLMRGERKRIRTGADRAGRLPRMTKARLVALLQGLRRTVSRLEVDTRRVTDWGGYEHSNSYTDAATAAKLGVVGEFVGREKPALVWDLGCNTGRFAASALAAGASRVIGFDTDEVALELAVQRADRECLDFLPLYGDLANPSPGNGWNGAERKSLADRRPADAVLALAVVHHLAIGRNIPLAAVIDSIVSLAPRGVIEFVPKSDPMVVAMLSTRQDIFADYDLPTFRAELAKRARTIAELPLPGSTRVLFTFEGRTS